MRIRPVVARQAQARPCRCVKLEAGGFYGDPFTFGAPQYPTRCLRGTVALSHSSRKMSRHTRTILWFDPFRFDPFTVATLRKEYGPDFAKGYRSDTKLETVREDTGKSLSELVKKK